MREYGITPIVVDPVADAVEAKCLYGITFEDMSAVRNMDAVIIAVSHEAFLQLRRDDIDGFFAVDNKKKVLMDLKGLFDRSTFTEENYQYWRL